MHAFSYFNGYKDFLVCILHEALKLVEKKTGTSSLIKCREMTDSFTELWVE